MKRQRKARPPELRKSKGGYDSNFERMLHKSVLKDWKHHGDKVEYVVEHKYEPDFIREFDGKTIYIEAKGRFWDYAEFVFIFADPDLPMPQAKRRKDGTRRSHADWATSKKFRWYTSETIPDEWRYCVKNKEAE